jgi:hypothetical protein
MSNRISVFSGYIPANGESPQPLAHSAVKPKNALETAKSPVWTSVNLSFGIRAFRRLSIVPTSGRMLWLGGNSSRLKEL